VLGVFSQVNTGAISGVGLLIFINQAKKIFREDCFPLRSMITKQTRICDSYRDFIPF
jgi:hypothetical protein